MPFVRVAAKRSAGKAGARSLNGKRLRAHAAAVREPAERPEIRAARERGNKNVRKREARQGYEPESGRPPPVERPTGRKRRRRACDAEPEQRQRGKEEKLTILSQGCCRGRGLPGTYVRGSPRTFCRDLPAAPPGQSPAILSHNGECRGETAFQEGEKLLYYIAAGYCGALDLSPADISQGARTQTGWWNLCMCL